MFLISLIMITTEYFSGTVIAQPTVFWKTKYPPRRFKWIAFPFFFFEYLQIHEAQRCWKLFIGKSLCSSTSSYPQRYPGNKTKTDNWGLIKIKDVTRYSSGWINPTSFVPFNPFFLPGTSFVVWRRAFMSLLVRFRIVSGTKDTGISCLIDRRRRRKANFGSLSFGW